MQKIIIIAGPTAVGKTALSIELAKAIQGEIVSADSRQVYRGLDIGTGKVTAEEMQGVPHHLLDVAEPKEIFSAAEYVEKARAAIAGIAARGRIPIVVGGTGFYIDALIGTTKLPDVAPDKNIRKELAGKSLGELREELERLDPERAQAIDMKNRVRLVRAIEIARTLGKVPKLASEKRYDVLWLGITLPKEELAEKISARLRARAEAGLFEEAERLHAEGLSYERMEELGLEYRYLSRYLAGTITREEMLRELETEIRKYAKRQMTWFKRNKEILWFSPRQAPDVLQRVLKWFSA